MRTLGNILWLVFGGIAMAVGYAVAGLVMFVLIITIPFGIQAFKLAGFALWPFGRVMVEIPGKGGCATTIGNVLWVVLAGFWLALGHLIAAFFLAITIIGIPLAIANVKLAGAALVPFGRTVVTQEEAARLGYRVVVAVEPLG
ncbi:MAG: YccF domain-containing protein [Actinomycetota bacterium]|nr:YccF domain-containing protein [Actinomycetota bacterium]